jgi:hypothetical protein
MMTLNQAPLPLNFPNDQLLVQCGIEPPHAARSQVVLHQDGDRQAPGIPPRNNIHQGLVISARLTLNASQMD